MAIGSLVAGVVHYTGIVDVALEHMSSRFQAFAKFVAPVFDGLKDAMLSGQFAEAAEVLWTSVEIVFRKGTQRIYDALLDGMTRAQNLLTDLGGVITDNFGGVLDWVVTSWETTVNAIAKKLIYLYSLFDKATDYEATAKMMDEDLARTQKARKAQGYSTPESRAALKQERIDAAAAKKSEFGDKLNSLTSDLESQLAAIKTNAAKKANEKDGKDGSAMLGGILGAMSNPGALLLNPQTWATIQKAMGGLKTKTDATTNPATKPDATAVGGTFSGFAAAMMGGSVSTFDRLLDKTNELVEFAKITAENTGADKAVAFGP